MKMAVADFKVGDLVWAKMKGHPFWPARIEIPLVNKKRKPHHYVFFFGSENFAWISRENIVHHSEEVLQSALNKKMKSTSYKLAIEKITSESGTSRDKPGRIVFTQEMVGFIGLGKMGQRIVKKLMNSSYKVVLWNRTMSKCDEFISKGAYYCNTPHVLIKCCDVTFCCVSGPEAVKAIFSGSCGVAAGFENTTGKGFVELSTLDIETYIASAKDIYTRGGTYLKASLTEDYPYRPLEAICAFDYDLFRKCKDIFRTFTYGAYFVR